MENNLTILAFGSEYPRVLVFEAEDVISRLIQEFTAIKSPYRLAEPQTGYTLCLTWGKTYEEMIEKYPHIALNLYNGKRVTKDWYSQTRQEDVDWLSSAISEFESEFLSFLDSKCVRYTTEFDYIE